VKAARTKVSHSKSRFLDIENNFDLDLTYISPSLIAMGVPSSDPVVSLYRNPLPQVANFFETRHRTSFRIYNACPELPYPTVLFEAAGGKVVAFEIQDHTPPTMLQFVQFLRDAREFTDQFPGGIVAVHCKGGKGRTGSLCAAWLLYSQCVASANAALQMFAKKRTNRWSKKLCGVETPSQVRYVQQMARHLERTESYFSSPEPVTFCSTPAIRLQALDLEGGLIARPHKTKLLRVLVQCGGATTSGLVLETPSFSPTTLSVSLQGVVVQGDVRISVFGDNGNGFSAHKAMTSVPNAHQAKGLVLLFLFHTAFMDMGDNVGKVPDESSIATEDKGRYRVSVENLDKANRRVKKGVHLANSSVSLSYSCTDTSRVIRDPHRQPVGLNFHAGALRESDRVTSMQLGHSGCTDGKAVEGCTTEYPQCREANEASGTTVHVTSDKRPPVPCDDGDAAEEDPQCREANGASWPTVHLKTEKRPPVPCDDTWFDDHWLHIAPPRDNIESLEEAEWTERSALELYAWESYLQAERGKGCLIIKASRENAGPVE